MPPVVRPARRGVLVFAGSDNTATPRSPMATVDMLELGNAHRLPPGHDGGQRPSATPSPWRRRYRRALRAGHRLRAGPGAQPILRRCSMPVLFPRQCRAVRRSASSIEHGHVLGHRWTTAPPVVTAPPGPIGSWTTALGFLDVTTSRPGAIRCSPCSTRRRSRPRALRQRRAAASRPAASRLRVRRASQRRLAGAGRDDRRQCGRDGLGREAPIITEMPGQFSGEISQLAGRGTLAAGRAGPEGCTALPFDAAHLRALVIGSAELGEIIMRALDPAPRRPDRERAASARCWSAAGHRRSRPAAGLPDPQRLSLLRARCRGDARGARA